MIEGFLFVLTLVTALGCGLIAGVFFAFSTFVMRALAQLPAARGIEAMNSINVTVINPWFMLAFLGTALASVVLVIAAIVEWEEPYAIYLLVGGLVYLAGVILLTGRYHVPRNDALAMLDPNAPDAESQWNHYVRTWTAGNHVRTIAPLASAALLTIALRVS